MADDEGTQTMRNVGILLLLGSNFFRFPSILLFLCQFQLEKPSRSESKIKVSEYMEALIGHATYVSSLLSQ